MRILLLTQYFPPETGAAPNRLSDLAKRLSLTGHEVTVLTSMPNYPQGKIFDGYRGRVFLEEEADGLRILRAWAYVSQRRGFVLRLINYLSFALLAVWIGIQHGGGHDVVVVESPPLFLGMSGFFLSRWYSAPMIVNVSDLWPESAVSIGILRNPVLIRIARALEHFIYRHSYAITGQTEGIVRDIRRRLSAVPVELITNGVDPDRFVPSTEQRQQTRALFGFGDRFVVGYTGLHGLAQGLDTLLQAADLLKDNDQDRRVLFAFFGDGPDKRRLQEVAELRKLTNVHFFSTQPADTMPAILSSLDAAIVPLKNLPLFRGALPSKFFDSMAARLPIVLAIEGEARALLERANGGICVPPEDAGALAGAVRHLAQSPALCRTLGENASRYVCIHYDRREMARRFDRLLRSIPRGSIETVANIAS